MQTERNLIWEFRDFTVIIKLAMVTNTTIINVVARNLPAGLFMVVNGIYFQITLGA